MPGEKFSGLSKLEGCGATPSGSSGSASVMSRGASRHRERADG
jgi:hypothetical protein